jgi:hypothetical protein
MSCDVSTHFRPLIGAHLFGVQSKINEAKEEAKRRAHNIDAQKASRTKGGMGMSGMSGGGMGSAAGMFEDERKANIPRPEPESDYGSMRKGAPPKGKGMVLGSKSKQSNDVLKAIQAEDALAGLSAPPPASKARDDRKQSQPAASNERSAPPRPPPALPRAPCSTPRARRAGRVLTWHRGPQRVAQGGGEDRRPGGPGRHPRGLPTTPPTCPRPRGARICRAARLPCLMSLCIVVLACRCHPPSLAPLP